LRECQDWMPTQYNSKAQKETHLAMAEWVLRVAYRAS
jgi:hypothetical protein